MASEQIVQALQRIQMLAAANPNPALRDAVDALSTLVAPGDVISVGNISGSTGVAIGRNIRLVVNQLNLPAETVTGLLEIRQQLGTSLGLDPNRYRPTTLLADKTQNFVGRDYVFHAIDAFLTSQRHGYFIIQGDPGLGKSAILAEYVRRTGCIVHFNIRSQGITSARHFLTSVCTQLIVDFGLPYANLPPDALEDGAFLSKLLSEASATRAPGERIVIAIDALDEVDLTSHPSGTNILFLPNTLPDGVYIVMTRRDIEIEMPFVVQAPQHLLDLLAHAAENRSDVELYLARSCGQLALQGWIVRQGLTDATFISTLADLSENNFMYLHYVLPEIERGQYQSLNIQELPTGLRGYYEHHWQHMGMRAKPLPRVKIRVIYILCEVRQPVSRQLISEFATNQELQVDELAVQEVLDEWQQFLHKEPAHDTTSYSVYHASFRDFLHRKDVVQAAGVSIQGINKLIADNLWTSLFGDG